MLGSKCPTFETSMLIDFSGNRLEGFEHRLPDPARRRAQAKNPGDGRGEVVRIYGRLNLMSGSHPGSVQNQGNLEFFHGRAAMAFLFAAVVGRHDDDGLFANAGVVQRAKQLVDQTVDLLNGLEVFWRFPAEGMPGMVHIVEMNEEKSWFALANDLDGAIGSSSRTFDILKEIRDARFDQPAKTVPVMDASDHCARLLFADYAKDSWENPARADCHRRNVEFVRLPIIRSDAVLFGACAHDHRRPVRAAARGHDTSIMERVRALTHQFVQNGRVRWGESQGAKAIAADDDDMLSR